MKASNLNHVSQHTNVNGHHFHPHLAGRETQAPQDCLSDEEEEESGQEDEDEEEMEEAPGKWQGIEAVFEAYQQYVDGESVLAGVSLTGLGYYTG